MPHCFSVEKRRAAAQARPSKDVNSLVLAETDRCTELAAVGLVVADRAG